MSPRMYPLTLNSRLQIPQGQIFWHETGQDGQTLIFLHGSWYRNRQWEAITTRLGKGYHCLAPDLPGFGDDPFAQSHLSINFLVECLEQYVELLKLERVYLIGHSIGAWVAAMYALEHPENVKGLVLIAPEGVESPEFAQRQILGKKLAGKAPWLYWYYRLIYPRAKFCKKHEKIEKDLQFRQQLIQSPATYNLLFKRRKSEIEAEFLNEKLPNLKIPLLVIYGSKDTPIVTSMSQIYSDLSAISD